MIRVKSLAVRSPFLKLLCVRYIDLPESSLAFQEGRKNLWTEMMRIGPPIALRDYAHRLFVPDGLLVGATTTQGIIAVADAHDASC
jgi:hypothetical protein